ncbi:MAG: hypothetical protein EOL97_12885 [Spirochaetia bacterium]|nr:hypothetical protein [Spirochaetia bacterium]
MKIDIPLKVKLIVTQDFKDRYRNAIEKSVNHIHKTIKNNYPGTTTKNALKVEINHDIGEARIGWDVGSKAEMIGTILETGSGERGKYGGRYVLSGQSAGPYKPKFGGKNPDYTVPIVPTRAKAMHFKGVKGDIYMKSFKGHIAKYKFSDGIAESMKFLPTIIDQEMKK